MSERQRRYFGIVNLNLNAQRKQQLVAALRELGENHSPYPPRRNHWCVRPDNEAVIFEAAFVTDNLTVAAFKRYLANVFSIQPENISHEVETVSFGPFETLIVTFSYNTTDYLDVYFFGGLDAGYYASHMETLAYIAANSAAWEG